MCKVMHILLYVGWPLFFFQCVKVYLVAYSNVNLIYNCKIYMQMHIMHMYF